MDIDKAMEFIKNSFLAPLLEIPHVTDISYNGATLFYVTNDQGRKRYEGEISYQEVKDFIRQIANMAEKQFSFQSPYLDVSIGNLRINAVHQSIARLGYQETITFSIRVGATNSLIKDNSSFLCPELVALLKILIAENVNIVIGGITGSGKTELQKYLIGKMAENTRLIVIDNVLELSNLPYEDIDLNVWQIDEKNKEANIQLLVRNALRSNPDWLIVAESRGAEMLEILNSAMTGHPIITTLHAFDMPSMPSRIGRMVMMNDKKMDYESVMQDVYYHFHFYIYLKREFLSNGKVSRFIAEIGEIGDDGKMHYIYKLEDNKRYFYPLSSGFLSHIHKNNLNKLPEVFK